MGYYLCQEHGEQFVVEAENLAKAQEQAETWGGEAIRPLTTRELSESEPEKGKFTIINFTPVFDG